MTQDTKRTLTPRLRFPEFRDGPAWAAMPVSDILTVRDKRCPPSADAPLFSLTIENGVTAKSNRYNREFLVADPGNKKYKLVRPNDIVYNPSNLRWGAINYSQLDHPVVVSPIYEVLHVTDTETTEFDFIARALMRPEQIARFIEKGQGTLVERIAVNIEFFLETSLPIPPSPAEQRKIAACLGSLDEWIGAESAKLEALRSHKKGLMQQLFPRPGESRPRLRFPEFHNAGEWETDRFANLYTFQRNNALSRDKLNYNAGNVKNVHYGDIHTKFQAHFDITREYVPFINDAEPVPSRGSDDYCVEGDLIFADASEDTNDVGKCIELVNLNGE